MFKTLLRLARLETHQIEAVLADSQLEPILDPQPSSGQTLIGDGGDDVLRVDLVAVAFTD